MLNYQDDLDTYMPGGSEKLNEKSSTSIFNYKYAKKLREGVVKSDELCNEYIKLIETVIAPHILSLVDDDTLIYQFPPSIRIYPSLTDERALGR